jgi:hypothetical protein
MQRAPSLIWLAVADAIPSNGAASVYRMMALIIGAMHGQRIRFGLGDRHSRAVDQRFGHMRLVVGSDDHFGDCADQQGVFELRRAGLSCAVYSTGMACLL